jgi:hypothetical protein
MGEDGVAGAAAKVARLDLDWGGHIVSFRCTAPVRQQSGVKRTRHGHGWIDATDPYVWSGRALQEGFVELVVAAA